MSSESVARLVRVLVELAENHGEDSVRVSALKQALDHEKK